MPILVDLGCLGGPSLESPDGRDPSRTPQTDASRSSISSLSPGSRVHFLSGDPTKKWTRDPGLKLEIELRDASVCGVRLGSRPSGLSRLGPPRHPKSTRIGIYSWEDLGMDAYFQNDILETYSIAINREDLEPGTSPFGGAVLLDGKPRPLGAGSRREGSSVSWANPGTSSRIRRTTNFRCRCTT